MGNGGNKLFGRKKVRQLYATYGNKHLYNSGRFKPLTRNLTTGALLNRTHHCERCDATMTQNCYDELHLAFCPHWITRKGIRRHCGERFTLRSDGCGRHPRSQGYNRALYRAANGEDVDLSEFDDPDPLNLNGEAEEDDDFEAEIQAVDKLAEKYFDENGYVPVNFYTNYFTARTKEKKYKASNAKPTPESDDAEPVPAKTIGKPGKGNYNKRRVITFADNVNNGRGASKGNATKGRKSLQPNDDDNGLPERSFAPKGSKPKAPKEAPHCPKADGDSGPVETKKGRAKTFVGKVLGKMTGKQ
jgi:hypothetical protein